MVGLFKKRKLLKLQKQIENFIKLVEVSHKSDKVPLGYFRCFRCKKNYELSMNIANPVSFESRMTEKKEFILAPICQNCMVAYAVKSQKPVTAMGIPLNEVVGLRLVANIELLGVPKNTIVTYKNAKQLLDKTKKELSKLK